MNEKEEKTSVISIRVPTDFKKKLQELAKKKDRSVGYLVLSLLKKSLK